MTGRFIQDSNITGHIVQDSSVRFKIVTRQAGLESHVTDVPFKIVDRTTDHILQDGYVIDQMAQDSQARLEILRVTDQVLNIIVTDQAQVSRISSISFTIIA